MAVNTISKVAGVTLSGSTNNQVVTVTGGNSLTGESNLTFDGSTLAIDDSAALLNIRRTDTGTAFADGTLLGAIHFGGEDSDSGADNDAAKIEIYTDQAWTATSHGTQMRFYTTKVNETSPTEIARIAKNANSDDPSWLIGGTTTVEAGVLEVQDPDQRSVLQMYNSSTGFTSQQSKNYVNTTASSGYRFLTFISPGNDYEFNLRGDGNAYCDAAWNGSGADYQEYFESQSGAAAEIGRTVVLDGDQIRYYNAATDSADDIIGVTRPEADNKNSAVVGNVAWNHWTDKYLTDDWGVYEREDVTIYQWRVAEPSDGESIHTVFQYSNKWLYTAGAKSEYLPVGSVTIPADAVQTTDNVRKLNPAYDPAQEENYQSREDRDEWWLIGLLGQIQIKAGEPTNPRWIKMKDISANVELWYVR